MKMSRDLINRIRTRRLRKRTKSRFRYCSKHRLKYIGYCPYCFEEEFEDLKYNG